MELTKKKLIGEGRKLFLEQGLISTSVDEITLAARTSKGSFYNYFDSKSDLLCEILHSYLTRLIENIDSTSTDNSNPSKDPVGDLIGNVAIFLEFNQQTLPLFRYLPQFQHQKNIQQSLLMMNKLIHQAYQLSASANLEPKPSNTHSDDGKSFVSKIFATFATLRRSLLDKNSHSRALANKRNSYLNTQFKTFLLKTISSNSSTGSSPADLLWSKLLFEITFYDYLKTSNI